MVARALNYIKDHIRSRALLVYVIIAVFVKCLILTEFAVNRTYGASDLWEAISEGIGWIPSLTVYLGWVLMLSAPCFLMRSKGFGRYLLSLNFIFSILFLIDLWYFRAFFKFSSISYISGAGNLHHLSSAVLSFIRVWDFLLVADCAVLSILTVRRQEQRPLRRNVPVFLGLFLLPLGYLAYFDSSHAIKGERVFSLHWEPLETISTLSPVGYHIVDLFSYWTEHQELILTNRERAKISTWFEENNESSLPNQYDGIFRGRNVILLQCESLENFVIGKSIAGQEITPTLNRIRTHSLYFKNILEQVSDGTSIDAEFIVNTSLYPLRTGYVSFSYPNHTYHSLPKLLQTLGYRTFDIHPDYAPYWNWAEFMQSVGMEECIDGSHFNVDEIIDLGLSDGSFFRQSIPILEKIPQPFYTYLITLSNHGPFDLPDNYRELKLDTQLNRSEVGGYLQSVHYMDKQIGMFLSQLEARGLLNNTVVGIFGDHCGIHKFYGDEINKLNENQRRWMENESRVPLLLFSKGMKGKVIDKIGGQIDIFPTIASLMGVPKAWYEMTAMGKNLLNSRKSFAVLHDGAFIGTALSHDEENHAVQGLKIADEIIRSDYFSSTQK